MKTLAEINEKYAKTAELPQGTDKGAGHTYIHSYESILAPYRETATAVLEVGVRAGYSLLLWRDYFTRAIIHGIDCRACNTKEVKQADRIKLIQQDIEVYPVLLDMFEDESLDVVIDDGSHQLFHQLLTVCIFLRKLKPGGVLVIEDVLDHDSYLLYQSFPVTVEIRDLNYERGSTLRDNVLYILRKKE